MGSRILRGVCLRSSGSSWWKWLWKVCDSLTSFEERQQLLGFQVFFGTTHPFRLLYFPQPTGESWTEIDLLNWGDRNLLHTDPTTLSSPALSIL